MPGFFAIIAFALTLTACTQDEVKGSGSVAAKILCDSVRNCTVHDDSSY